MTIIQECKPKGRRYCLFRGNPLSNSFPCLRAKKSKASAGYTLLETLVSLIILMSVVVPLVTYFYRGTLLTESRRELEGTWLVEQEAAVIKLNPDTMLPVKRRYIGGREWTIRSEKQNGTVTTYRIAAELAGKEKAQAVFYGIDYK